VVGGWGASTRQGHPPPHSPRPPPTPPVPLPLPHPPPPPSPHMSGLGLGLDRSPEPLLLLLPSGATSTASPPPIPVPDTGTRATRPGYARARLVIEARNTSTSDPLRPVSARTTVSGRRRKWVHASTTRALQRQAVDAPGEEEAGAEGGVEGGQRG
jgi:hypothetical protein